MGSYSFSCQLSGLPITSGEKAVIVPIIPKDNWYDNSEKHIRKFGLPELLSNDAEKVCFSELCFPIFGEYNDYGSIENIVRDDNIKVLEEYFGLSIEDIVTVLTDNRKDEFPSGGEFCDSVEILDKKNPKHMLLLRTSCTWIHGDLYERLAKYDGKLDYFDKLDLGVDEVLTSLGFVFKKEIIKGGDSEKNRYNKIYEKDGLTIKSDGNWIHIDSVYDMKDFKKYCAKNGVEIDISPFEKKGYQEQIYDYILPHIKNLKGSDRWGTGRVVHMLLGDEFKVHGITHASVTSFIKNKIDKIKDDNQKKGKKIDEHILKLEKDMLESEEDLEPEINNAGITIFYFKKIKEIGNDFMKKNIVDWHKVKRYYYFTGRFLFPIGTSPQDGEHRKVRELLQMSLDSINQTIKEREEDDEDDES